MKILYVSTISNTINAFMIPHIEMLLDQGHEVHIACNINREISPILLNRGCKVYNIKFQRSPFKKQNIVAYKKLKQLIIEGEYDVVHTHTPVASVCTRLACKKVDNVKVIYTAHGFHFYKGASFKDWLVYYPVERYLARYTDILITINKEDYERANKSFKAGRIEYIPGVGIDTKKFNEVVVDRTKKRSEIGVPDDAFLILSVGELGERKNHEAIIRAIAMLNDAKIYYIICGQGPLEKHLRDLSKELGIEHQTRLLGVRKDIAEMCKASDLFAFPSKREGLGIAALEAMASGLPIITSNIQGIVDYSVNGKTGYSYSPKNINGFANGIKELKSNKVLRDKMGLYNEDTVERFSIEKSKSKLQNIYQLVSK
ncbi:glycosyltransferase family 4 protein [Peribacillus sp. SCS-155]|uniref:glycosyltransferase family 4 protein n=1 Tax=Peribacillus sedimenti TaxID=3115297 RepID=UPI003906BDE3